MIKELNGYGKLILGDCLENMKEIEDKSIDLVLCDLPYGTTQNKWDSVLPLEPLWLQYERIIKDDGVIVLFAQTPFDKVLGASNLRLLKYEWIWQKNVATGHLNANKMPMKEHENILVFYKNKPTYNPQFSTGHAYTNIRKPINDNGSNYGKIIRTNTVNEGKRFPKSILKFDREIGLHSTQKPTLLCEFLIKTHSNEGDLILDNCSGSGTTGIAAINTNRRFILIEKDEIYFNKSVDRISNHILNPHKKQKRFSEIKTASV